ncbi:MULTISPECIES: 30S ribosomal protein S17 [Acidithiobacillus]|jgi:small subunit ribosomal protein S17|uniref:Small ribosomal subunit protein uS17 n=3 Tax=Acidithiobacillus caldus TaxID=33059 RepID=F9ZM52_ACICS|nr:MULTISPECIES: 30S ribosomal protein S17 [Acidithiobacillus]AEK57263.1 SSU ribosomal protein S17p (S11e) [Acidithiobacillus caldus SM-1]AIA54507.1 SSU ribosomal protein S17p (S11e) [Acidithiobacillus caldus ATCC 51756]AUW32018.1 30S ribosomal protein S17 [Acidithiobacillus caldus]MBU2730056.1 30S ribosomal protein S17 [Acidithiobacillus caldus]MBU2734796.1 30S ribosomal protein S17 [Acidithiobacillus caldus ATCC 51756]
MSEEKKPRSLVGKVVSNRMDKTIVVTVERRVQHPLYKKYIRRSKKFHAHDAENTCRIGDTVRIEECRPLSKTKTWRLVTVISEAIEEGVQS